MHFGVLLSLLLLSGWAVCQNRPLDCTCTDVDPRFGADKHLKFTRARCWEHLKEGDCEKGFMFNTIYELSEDGFCQITCGRCNCCGSLRDVAETEGLTDWIWAMETAGLTDVGEPGWEVAALAPRNGAVATLLQELGGWSRRDVESDPSKSNVLRNVLLFNLISPVPNHWAVYTSPFFADGLRLPTEAVGAPKLRVKRSGDSVRFEGPSNTATLANKDVDKASCKGYIHVTNQFVLPSEGARTAVSSGSRGGGRCGKVVATVYDGRLIETVKADHAEDCCAKCQSSDRCNVWTFCPEQGGCHKGNEAAVWWGDCQLKRDSRVAEGGFPSVQANGADVLYESGHVTTDARPAAG